MLSSGIGRKPFYSGSRSEVDVKVRGCRNYILIAFPFSKIGNKVSAEDKDGRRCFKFEERGQCKICSSQRVRK